MKPLLCVVLGPNDNNWTSIFIVVGVVCALLVALLIAALYLLRIRQNKGGWVPWFLPESLPLGCTSQTERGLCFGLHVV